MNSASNSSSEAAGAPRRRVVVATHNAHKVTEICAILDIPGWEFVSLDELGIFEEAVEDASNFVGNARIKAQFAYERCKLAILAGDSTLAQLATPAGEFGSAQFAVLADDSGLAVDALGGAPGVFSSRYAEVDADDAANNQKLLAELEGLSDIERAAAFVCALVFIDEQGNETVAEGSCIGRIGTEPRGNNGFGYDPLFLVPKYAYERTLAELSAGEKNALSHRALALKQLRGLLVEAEQHTDSESESDEPRHCPHERLSDDESSQAAREVQHTATSPKKQIVAFDFDGTLIDASSPVRLITRLNRDRIMSKRAVVKSMLWGARYKTGSELDQAKPRRYIFASFKNFSASDANAIMKNLYHEELRQKLRPQAIAALKHHQEAGQELVIVSASFAPIISELCKEFGIQEYICTQMEVVAGSYTGETIGDPPESEQKLVQFTAWANDKYGIDGWELAYAYGDHHSDIPLMETARHPIAVDPDRRLDLIAKERGWQVHDWPLNET